MSFLLGEYARVHVRDSYPFYHYSHATFIYLTASQFIFLSAATILVFCFIITASHYFFSHSLRSWSWIFISFVSYQQPTYLFLTIISSYFLFLQPTNDAYISSYISSSHYQ